MCVVSFAAASKGSGGAGSDGPPRTNHVGAKALCSGEADDVEGKRHVEQEFETETPAVAQPQHQARQTAVRTRHVSARDARQRRLDSIAGFVASALWSIPASMVADIADEDELRTGQRREGTFFGINSFLVQDAASLAVLVSGILVDHFAKLVPGQVEQSAQTINRLAILYSLLPATLFLGTACLMLRYRLTRYQVESVHRKLAHRRAERLR